MPLFEWNEQFSVKVKLFDEQHQKLVSLVNQLYDAMHEGKGTELLNSIFSDLVQYTASHFKAEEELMQRYNFPDAASHISEHNDLTKQALDLQAKFQKGALFVSIETLEFLKNWLTRHIMQTDKNYGGFFNLKGVF